MKNIRRYLLLLCIVLPSLAGQAQSDQWVVDPHYDSVTPVAPTLFKVRNGAMMALINLKGETIIVGDSITNFTNGYALHLTRQKNKFMVKGIISSSGSVSKVSGEYYADDYAFFSEDKCPVMNKKGKYGYMNTYGMLVIPFTYVSVHPFREGLASVSKKKGGLKGLFGAAVNFVNSDAKLPLGPSLYIDEKGKVLDLQTEIGTPELATTFSEGRAYVRNSKGRGFFIDKNGNIVKMADDVALELDDYFILSDTKERANHPYVSAITDDEGNRYVVGEKDGKYGIKKILKPVVKVHEESSEKIGGNRSNVHKGGGIVASVPASVTANAKGYCVIPVTVVNRSGVNATVVVSTNIGGSKTIVVAPGRSNVASITTKVVKNTRCTITAKSSVGSSKCSTLLKAGFVL